MPQQTRFVAADIDGNVFDRSVCLDPLPAWEHLASPGVRPLGSGREVNLPLAHPEFGYRGNEDIRPEQEFIFHDRGLGVILKSKNNGRIGGKPLAEASFICSMT